jgi:hypothetical protein
MRWVCSLISSLVTKDLCRLVRLLEVLDLIFREFDVNRRLIYKCYGKNELVFVRQLTYQSFP